MKESSRNFVVSDGNLVVAGFSLRTGKYSNPRNLKVATTVSLQTYQLQFFKNKNTDKWREILLSLAVFYERKPIPFSWILPCCKLNSLGTDIVLFTKLKDKLPKLEMMRGFAALYVMAGHYLLHFSRESNFITWPFRFGQETVMLFFLISGFVISLSTEQQQPNFITYLSKRWRRIYPIFLLALLLGTIDTVILRAKPFPWREFLGNLFMLQDFSYGKPGVWFSAFGGNSPLWSLAYEWWFYLLFYPIWRFVPRVHQRTVAAVLSLIGLVGYCWHPNQPCLYVAYFILWWTGVEFARQYAAEKRVTFKGQRIPLTILGCFICLAALMFLSTHHWTGDLRFGLYPILQIRHFAACLAICAGALIWQQLKWAGFNSLFGIFRYVAPVSYGIYALHYEIGISGSFVSLFPALGSLQMPVVVMVCLALAWLAEVPYQNFVNRWTRPFPRKTILELPKSLLVNTAIASSKLH